MANRRVVKSFGLAAQGGKKEAKPEGIPVKRSFRNKSAEGPAVLFWNDTWVADVMQENISASACRRPARRTVWLLFGFAR